MPSRTATITPIAEGNRQDRRRARTRAELLAAAKRLLASKGFHATKIADIAAAADVGTGTFYLHFPTKDALFTDLVKETALRAKDEIDRAAASGPNATNTYMPDDADLSDDDRKKLGEWLACGPK